MKRLIVSGLLMAGLAGVIASPLLQGINAQPTVKSNQNHKEPVSYRDVVKKVLPAVVSIESKARPVKAKDSRKRNPGLEDPRIPEELRKFFEEFRRHEEDGPEEGVGGFGSGFIVDPAGVIVTNNHVVEGADKVEITLQDGRKFSSSDIKGDPKTDLAIIRINAKNLPSLELGDSDAMEIGDRVLALGAPFGLTGTVTSGIISAKGRSLRLNFYEDFLQTDAAINPGNSGGPLVNLEGKVVGVNSAIKTRNGGFQGVGMAITSKLTASIKDQLLRDGTVRRGYLGVSIKDIDDGEIASKLGLKNAKGIIVTQVMEDGPAGKGGVQSGDIILKVASTPVKDSKDLQFAVASLPLGKPVDVLVVRDGKEVTLKVTIEEQPKQFGITRNIPQRSPEKPKIEGDMNLDKLGIEVGELNPSLAEKFGYKASAKGVVILKVERESLGFQAGLRPGMVIARVDKKPVTASSELKALTENANYNEGVLFQIQLPDGGTDYILVRKK